MSSRGGESEMCIGARVDGGAADSILDPLLCGCRCYIRSRLTAGEPPTGGEDMLHKTYTDFENGRKKRFLHCVRVFVLTQYCVR